MFLNLNEPDEPGGNGYERPSKHRLFFSVIFLASLLWNLPHADFSRLFSPLNLFYIIQAALIAGVWSALLQLVDFYIWPAFVEWFSAPPKEAASLSRPVVPSPSDEDEQEERIEQTAVPLPEGERVLIGSRYVNLADYGIAHSHWLLVQIARRQGKMATVSKTSLQEKFGMSEGEATAVNDMLLELGLVEDGGYRQPNRFTVLGERVLPASPTDIVTVH